MPRPEAREFRDVAGVSTSAGGGERPQPLVTVAISEASSVRTPLSPRVYADTGGPGQSPARAWDRLPLEEDKPQEGRLGVKCSWLLSGGSWRWGRGGQRRTLQG